MGDRGIRGTVVHRHSLPSARDSCGASARLVELTGLLSTDYCRVAFIFSYDLTSGGVLPSERRKGSPGLKTDSTVATASARTSYEAPAMSFQVASLLRSKISFSAGPMTKPPTSITKTIKMSLVVTHR